MSNFDLSVDGDAGDASLRRVAFWEKAPQKLSIFWGALRVKQDFSLRYAR